MPSLGAWTRIPAPSEAAILAATSALHGRGLQVVRSFDLRQALMCQGDLDGDACGCQYAVLLAYSEQEGPVVVTAHADARSTNFRVLPAAGSRGLPRLQVQVEITLQTLASTWEADE